MPSTIGGEEVPKSFEPIRRGVKGRHVRREGEVEEDRWEVPGPPDGMGNPGESPPRVGIKVTSCCCRLLGTRLLPTGLNIRDPGTYGLSGQDLGSPRAHWRL